MYNGTKIVGADLPALTHTVPLWTQKYRKTTYKEFGRDLQGLDCWGLAWLIYQSELGTDIGAHTEIAYEGDKANREEIDRTLVSGAIQFGWTAVAVAEPVPEKPGYRRLKFHAPLRMFDILLIKIGKYRTHVAVACSKKHMIHILGQTEVTVEEFTHPTWYQRIDAVYRHPRLV